VLLTLAVAVALPALAKQREDAKPAIEELSARWAGNRAYVSYQLSGSLPAETLDKIHSGIPVGFRHRIEIVSKRRGLFAPDKLVARVIVDKQVEYDSLTQRYTLKRTVEIKSQQKSSAPEPREERQVIDSEGEMRSWVATQDEIPLFDPARPFPEEADLRVRVEVALGRRWFLLIFPSTQTVSAEIVLGAGE
jgi:hypothetical protein